MIVSKMADYGAEKYIADETSRLKEYELATGCVEKYIESSINTIMTKYFSDIHHWSRTKIKKHIKSRFDAAKKMFHSIYGEHIYFKVFLDPTGRIKMHTNIAMVYKGPGGRIYSSCYQLFDRMYFCTHAMERMKERSGMTGMSSDICRNLEELASEESIFGDGIDIGKTDSGQYVIKFSGGKFIFEVHGDIGIIKTYITNDMDCSYKFLTRLYGMPRNFSIMDELRKL